MATPELGHRMYGYTLWGRITLWSHWSAQNTSSEQCIVVVVNAPQGYILYASFGLPVNTCDTIRCTCIFTCENIIIALLIIVHWLLVNTIAATIVIKLVKKNVLLVYEWLCTLDFWIWVRVAWGEQSMFWKNHVIDLNAVISIGCTRVYCWLVNEVLQLYTSYFPVWAPAIKLEPDLEWAPDQNRLFSKWALKKMSLKWAPGHSGLWN